MSGKQGSGSRRRRVRGLVGLVISALVLGALTWFAGAAGNTERVTSMWVNAQVAKDGSARITEVIDYDFGHPPESRHGIYRDIPGLTYEVDDEDVRVTMDGAPVPYELSYGDTTERSIRIGDAGRTVTGPHRYRITYPLPDVVRKGKLAWDAVGTGWKVDLHDVTVHVAGSYRWLGSRCVRGRTGSVSPCRWEQPSTGHLVASFGKVASGQGVTLYGATDNRSVSDLVRAVRPAPPAGARPDAAPSPDPLRTGLVLAGLVLLCGVSTMGVVWLIGRDRHPADLARPAEGTPPEGLTPAEGGILLTERVEARHQVAWLLTAAARGHISVTGSGQHPVLRRVPGLGGVPDEDTAAVIDDMFAGRDQFVLGLYDPLFRSAWQSLGFRLATWQRTSDLWDPAAQRRQHAAIPTGLGATLLGLVAALTGSVLVSHMNSAGWPVATGGGLLTGVGMALCLSAWELRRRSARGAALLAQVESFRHWLAEAPPRAAEDDDRLETLTAWAVALGVAERWERTVAAATAPAATRGGPRRATAVSRLGPALAVGLVTAAVVSARAPSSSGSSGNSGSSGGSFGGDGVGGGTGGGGGGSW
ncbi:DUF2207 domain-containing protein [Streptomyces sp. NPDC102406]|uniref:DUF2207 domain-containing protein n=1 Tax=Streptomyces sp. NPDC102406 TaxID=3366171 RepID=UPI0038213E83